MNFTNFILVYFAISVVAAAADVRGVRLPAAAWYAWGALAMVISSYAGTFT